MKITISDMKKLAKTRNGQCLSEEYINNYSKLKWQCKEGHQWEAAPTNIKTGKWCPVCGGTQRGTIEAMQRIAKKNGGQCLSEEYINNYTKLKWQCKAGHQWEAVPADIKRGSWCLICSGSQKGTIEAMQRIAQKHGGRCLSEEYINNYTKLKWRCKEGHQWEAVPSSIKRGSWCPFCARKQ